MKIAGFSIIVCMVARFHGCTEVSKGVSIYRSRWKAEKQRKSQNWAFEKNEAFFQTNFNAICDNLLHQNIYEIKAWFDIYEVIKFNLFMN